MTLLLLVLGCASRIVQPTVPTAQLPAGRLVIAHTNDLHAHYLPERAEWRADEATLGGFVAIDSWVRGLEQQFGADNVLYLDGGDVLTGTPLMELEPRGVAGGAMLELFDSVGVDGFVLGNHEFDRAFDHTAAWVAQSRVPALTANVRQPCGPDPLACPPAFDNTQPWHIYQVNGVTVGVFGLTTSGLGHLTDPDTMSRLALVDHDSAARAAVAELEPQVDLVVALTHIGLENDRALAEAVDGIDLIVGGHSHTRMEAAEKIDDTWIVQAASYGRILGVAELAVADGVITDFDWRPEELRLDALPLPPRDELVAQVQGYQAELERRFSVAVSDAAQTLPRGGGGETPLGRWASDVVRIAAQADVGIYNAGGIRSDLVAGPVTVGSLYDIFPFSNEVVWFELTGDELLGIMLNAASAEISDNRGTPQLSGLRFEWRLRLGAPEIVQATVGGQPLDLSRTYKVATNSFVAAQWQRNLGVDPGEVFGTGGTVLEAAIALGSQGPIADPADRRSVRVDP